MDLIDNDRICPESDIGNIEYKLRLLNTSDFRIEELTTQMRFRINEGNGECFYILGIKDNGILEGISEEEFDETYKIMKLIASKNNYSINLLSVHDVLTNTEVTISRKVYEFIVRQIGNKYIDLKITVAGSVDASKTSLIGTLTSGVLDNGRGLSRSSIFNYIHELKSGRTSSIAQHIMGYDVNGNIINYKDNNTWEDIVNKSSKVITFIDLAGHEAYLKTTIMGISASHPDLCFIVISANNGVSKITTEHIFLCVTMGIPFVIILSKIDICVDRKNVLDETLANIKKILKYPGLRRIPLPVKNIDDVILAAKNVYSESVVPIFHISNVTGEGLDNVKQFLNILGKRNNHDYNNDNIEFHVENVFNVYGFGTVVGGQLLRGTIKTGDKLFVGPLNNEYQPIVVKSIHCKKVPVQTISCGSYVCLGIKKKLPIKRGQVIVSSKDDMIKVKKFTAHLTVLKSNSSTIKVGYEPILHTASIRETVKIVDISDKVNARRDVTLDDTTILRSGDKGLVTLEFKYNHYFLKENTKIILCEGITKITGTVNSVFKI